MHFFGWHCELILLNAPVLNRVTSGIYICFDRYLKSGQYLNTQKISLVNWKHFDMQYLFYPCYVILEKTCLQKPQNFEVGDIFVKYDIVEYQ